MKRIIEEIYYGNLKIEERVGLNVPEYRLLNRRVSDLMEEAKKKFRKVNSNL